MAVLAPDMRPLPERIVVVAFPDAIGQAMPRLAASSRESDFFVVQADSQDIVLPHNGVNWLKLSPPTAIAAGISRVGYSVKDNTESARHVEVPVTVRGKRYAVTFSQQPGELVQLELVRTLNCPLNLDCLIAVTFVADLIKKIPVPPIKLVVTIVAILAIVALGFVVSTLRHGFVTVPEPKPLSTDTNKVPITVIPGVAVSYGLPLANVAAEDQVIALQTIKAIYWLIKQVE